MGTTAATFSQVMTDPWADTITGCSFTFSYSPAAVQVAAVDGTCTTTHDFSATGTVVVSCAFDYGDGNGDGDGVASGGKVTPNGTEKLKIAGQVPSRVIRVGRCQILRILHGKQAQLGVVGEGVARQRRTPTPRRLRPGRCGEAGLPSPSYDVVVTASRGSVTEVTRPHASRVIRHAEQHASVIDSGSPARSTSTVDTDPRASVIWISAPCAS
jgi:hypothetical protein